MSETLDEQWAEAIQRELATSSLYRYAPMRSQPRGMRLEAEGTISMGGSAEMRKWRVELREAGPTLLLTNAEGHPTATLTLDPDGVWCGREASGDKCRLTCISSRRGSWKALASQRTFSRAVAIDPNDPDFRYLEPLARGLDWSAQRYDICETEAYQKERMRLPEVTTAVAVVGHDRPTYFSQTVRALAKNARIHELPVFVFLDYTENQDATDEQEELAKDLLPGCVVTRRPVNFGCGRNIIDARRQLFDNLGYARVFVFEDDMVPGSQYLFFCERLLDWAMQNYANVGAVQGWNLCVMGPATKQTHLAEVRGTFANWWGYLMHRRAWRSFAPCLYRYEDLFLGAVRYNDRPHRSILDWFKRRDAEPRTERNPGFPVDAAWRASLEAHWRSPATGQDAATEHLFHAAGWVRLAPVVNRGLYIGQRGIHMSPPQFVRDGFSAMQLDEFGETLTFEPVEPGGCTHVQPSPYPGFRYVEA